MNDYSPKPQTLAKLLPDAPALGALAQLLVSDVQTDSRLIAPGALFVAVKNHAGNGEDYIAHAVANGAVAIVVDAASINAVLKLEIPIIGITNLETEAADIIARFFSYPANKVDLIGVTGTNGKSTITSLVAQLATRLDQRGAVIGTVGYGFPGGAPLAQTGMTTPDFVSTQRIISELVERGAQMIALEVSSHGIHQKRVDTLRFKVAVLSNITHDHLDYHGSFEEYARVKASWILSDGALATVINADDAECLRIAAQAKAKNKTCVLYGIANKQADVCAEIISFEEDGIVAKVQSPWGSAQLRAPIIGEFNLSNLLAAITALCVSGFSFHDVLARVGKIVPVAGRMQKVKIPQSKIELPNVYVDFAHSPDALEKVLLAIKKHTRGKLWVVFGCGGDRDKSKRPVMGEIAARLADYVIVTSDNPRSENPEAIMQNIRQGIDTPNVDMVVNRETAIALAIHQCSVDDLVLIAGKGHENYQIIGEKRFPFSDYLIAKKSLIQRQMRLEAK